MVVIVFWQTMVSSSYKIDAVLNPDSVAGF
jgi:hypothetical protein